MPFHDKDRAGGKDEHCREGIRSFYRAADPVDQRLDVILAKCARDAGVLDSAGRQRQADCPPLETHEAAGVLKQGAAPS